MKYLIYPERAGNAVKHLLTKKKTKYSQRYLYVLSKVFHDFVSNQKYMEKYAGRVPIHTNTLRSIIGSKLGLTVLSELCKHDILRTSGSYLPGKCSKLYEINPSLLIESGIVIEKITDLRLLKKITTNDFNDSSTLSWLKANLERIRINRARLEALAKHFELPALHLLLNDINMNNDKGEGGILAAYDSPFCHKSASLILSVINIIYGNFYLFRDKKGKRVYTNMTNLKKILRSILYVDGVNQLLEVDITNSQPFILACMLREKYAQSLTGMPEDVAYFNHLCVNGTLYKELGELLSLETKDEAKGKMFQILFSPNETFLQMKSIKLFRDRFPEVTNYLKEKKDEGHIGFAIELQRKESDVIIDTVVPKLMEHDPSMFITTIHDSLIYEEKHHDVVIKAIQDAFEAKYGIVPQLKQGLPGGALIDKIIDSPSVAA